MIEPPELSTLELDVMRGGLGLAVLFALDGLRMFRNEGGLTHPVGIARWVDLGWLARRRLLLHRVAAVAAVAYVLGRWTLPALLVVSVVLVADVTANASAGSVNHSNHLVTVAVLAQCAALATWDGAARWGWDLGTWVADSRAVTASWWSIQAVLAVYFTAGLSKLLGTSGGWIFRSPGLLVSAAARVELTYGIVRPEREPALRRTAELVERLLPRPGLTRLAMAGGLLVELAAPLALLGENARLAVGLALVALHLANQRLLWLSFPNYQIVVLALLVNLPRFWR